MRPTLLFATIVWLAATAPALAFLAYVSNEKSNTVSVIDTDKWAVIQTIKVGQRPRGIEFTRDGKFVLVAVGDDDTIEVIDTTTQQVVDKLPSGPDPELFVQDAAGKILYVANENDNTVTIIDLEKREAVREIKVGKNDPTDGQDIFASTAMAAGARCFVVYSIEDVEAALRTCGVPVAASAQGRDQKRPYGS